MERDVGQKDTWNMITERSLEKVFYAGERDQESTKTYFVSQYLRERWLSTTSCP